MFGIRRGIAYLLASFKLSVKYKFNVWMQIVGVVLLISIQFFLWKSIDNYDPSLLNGLQVNTILLYVVFSRLLVFILPGNGTTNFISEKILKGTIAIDLLRPVHLQICALFHELGKLVYTMIFIVAPSIIITMFFLDIPTITIEGNELFCFLLSIVLAYMLAFQMSFMIGVFSIWFGNVWGVREFYEALLIILGGSLIPISLYPDFVQTIAVYSPFQSIYFTPLAYLTNMEHVIHFPIGVQLFWFILFRLFNLFLLRFALKRAVIQGG